MTFLFNNNFYLYTRMKEKYLLKAASYEFNKDEDEK